MLVFGNDTKARGCFTSFELGSFSGAYIELPEGDTLPTKIYNEGDDSVSNTDPMMVRQVSFAQKESYHLVKCFNDVVHTYAFGHDPASSMISVVFTGFVIDKDGSKVSNVFERFVQAYGANRLSATQQPAEVVIGSQSLLGYVISMKSSTSDSHHNLQDFHMDLIATEVQK